MPVERISLSSSQLADLVGVDPSRLITIDKVARGQFVVVLEPEPKERDEPARRHR